MSPYPVQTDRKAIIETARALIERDGVEHLSLGSVASELGIKAPSLYRHVKGKGALLRAVIEQTYQDLFSAYDEALSKLRPVAGRFLWQSRASGRFGRSGQSES